MTRVGRKRARGGAAVELTVVLPVLITLGLGCVDFGRFTDAHLTVTNAARAGSEFASTHPYTPATYSLWQEQVRQVVVDEVAGLNGFDPARLTVIITPITAQEGPTRFEVDVSYRFETVIDWPGVPNTLTVRRVSAMPMSRP